MKRPEKAVEAGLLWELRSLRTQVSRGQRMTAAGMKKWPEDKLLAVQNRQLSELKERLDDMFSGLEEWVS